MELFVKEFAELTVGELYEILKLRAEVFVVEQNCPYQDLDDEDNGALHIWLDDKGKLAAYLRIIKIDSETVKIGRVIAAKRRCGLGTQVLKAGITVAKERYGAKAIQIHAQTYAKEFYEKQGFIQTSEEFLEVGIPHIGMELTFQEI